MPFLLNLTSSFALAKALIGVILSIRPADRVVNSGAHLTLVSSLSLNQLLQLVIFYSEDWQYSKSFSFFLFVSSLLLDQLVENVLDHLFLLPFLQEFFFASSEVLELILETIYGAEIFVGNSFLSTNRHVSLGTVLTTEFDRGTSPVRTELDSNAVQRTFIVIGKSVHSTNWSEFLFTITRSFAGSFGNLHDSQTVQETRVFISESIHPTDRPEKRVPALARKKSISLLERRIATRSLVTEGNTVSLKSALIEIGNAVFSTDGFVKRAALLLRKGESY